VEAAAIALVNVGYTASAIALLIVAAVALFDDVRRVPEARREALEPVIAGGDGVDQARDHAQVRGQLAHQLDGREDLTTEPEAGKGHAAAAIGHGVPAVSCECSRLRGAWCFRCQGLNARSGSAPVAK
jgi:hypothetical protein